MTANDYTLQLYNGETGAAVLRDDGRLRAWISGSGGLHDFATGRLDAVETMHAMTIHKSQGSQARRITVLLPDAGSRLLTRELFYTAVTRAQEHVRVVGSEEAVRAAVGDAGAAGDRAAPAAARRAHVLTGCWEPKPAGNVRRIPWWLIDGSEMPFLLRVELPDVPGSLGRLAGAIGEAGGDIEAIEIVEKAHDGVAVDDVLLETAPGAMPDSIVSACNALDGVRVLWISRYAAGGNVFLDLEAVEDLTAHPMTALDRLVDLLPAVFRSDWGARVSRDAGVLHSTGGAPEHVPWAELDRAVRLEVEDENTLLVAARLDDDEIARHRPPRRPGVPRLRARPARPPRLAGDVDLPLRRRLTPRRSSARG